MSNRYSQKLKNNFQLLTAYLELEKMIKKIKTQSFLDDFSILHKNPSQAQTVLRHRHTSQLILMKELQIEPQQHEATKATLSYQRKLYHQQLISLIDFYPQPWLNKFIVFYEYCSISLEEEYSVRVAEGRGFEEAQLWSIVSSLVFGLAYLEEVNVGHGSISLADCYLNEKGFIKICDPTFATSNPFLIVPGYYYSPELLSCVSAHMSESHNVDVFKSDVFALGCCMLQLSLMTDLTQLYDYENGLIDFEGLEEYVEELNQYYSREYVTFLKEMLVVDGEKRVDLLGLKVKIFGLLSLEPEEKSERLLRQSSEIKSSISSLKKSIHESRPSSEPHTFTELKKSKTIKNSILYTQDVQVIDEQAERKQNPTSSRKSSRYQPQQSDQGLEEMCMNSFNSKEDLNRYSFGKSVRVTDSIYQPGEKENLIKSKQKTLKKQIIKPYHISSESTSKFIKIEENSPESKQNWTQRTENLVLSKRESIRLEKENNYTNPDFLQMMQQEVKQIMKKRYNPSELLHAKSF